MGEIEEGLFHPLADDIFAAVERTGEAVPLVDVALLSPLAPEMVLLMIGAFKAPGEVRAPDAVPWMMPKLTSRLVGDHGDVVVGPGAGAPLWAEVELAVVIGKELCNADPDEAGAAIFGFTCFNDLTAGELSPTMDLFRAKSIESFAAMGPWICTDLKETDVQAGLALSASVNGVVQARGNTKDFRFSVSEVVSYASHRPRLSPGNVISLGTPQVCQIHVGDVVELTVEGVGTLHHRIVAA